MIKKYKPFINENLNMTEFKFKKTELFNKLKSNGTYLYASTGLNLLNTINSALNKYKSDLTQLEIDNFYKGLNILKQTDYPNINSILSNKISMGIEFEKNLKVDGVWSYVNKLNTNYSDLSDLIVNLIEKLVNNKDDNFKSYGITVYNAIMDNDYKILSNFRERLPNIIDYFFEKNGDGLNEFLKFMKNSEHQTEVGNKSEDIVIKFLVENGFEILFQGTNGCYIDMVFGVDIIARDTKDRFGFVTIQVKTTDYKLYKKFDQYKNKGINWGIAANSGDIKIYNLQNDYKLVNIIDDNLYSQKETPNNIDTLESKININLSEQIIRYDDKKILIKKCNRMELYKDTLYYVRGVEDIESLKDTNIDQVGFMLTKNGLTKICIFNNPQILKTRTDPFNITLKMFEIKIDFLDIEIEF